MTPPSTRKPSNGKKATKKANDDISMRPDAVNNDDHWGLGHATVRLSHASGIKHQVVLV